MFRFTKIALLAWAAAAPPALAGDYALRDSDTVVFLGDSITAAHVYSKHVENYTLLRFPDRKVRFVNAGGGGDTAEGGLARLESDVLPHEPTVLIVAYGVNDIGWGTKADTEHERRYLDAVRGIVEACNMRGIRLYLCSAAVTAGDPDEAESGFLQAMCDQGMAISREGGQHAIDVQRTMRGIQRKVIEAARSAKPDETADSLHVADGVHLTELGQLAMAFAILKGLDAPPRVSSVVVDANGLEVIEQAGCTASNLVGDEDGVAFDRLDEGLPMSLGVFGGFQYRYVPIPGELNGYRVAVRGLEPGEYEIKAEGRSLGKFSADRLAEGMDVASARSDVWEPGGPWEATAWELSRITDARDQVAQARQALAGSLANRPDREALREESEAIDARLIEHQRSLVRPRPFRFEVRRVPEAPAVR